MQENNVNDLEHDIPRLRLMNAHENLLIPAPHRLQLLAPVAFYTANQPRTWWCMELKIYKYKQPDF